MGGGLGAMPLGDMKKFSKYFIMILPLLVFSCSSTQVIMSDCFPGPSNGLEIKIIAYSYNYSTKYAFLSGIVLDKNANDFIIGANVTLLPCNNASKSDLNGRFNFEYQPKDCDSLQTECIGYYNKTFSLNKLLADYVAENRKK